MDKMHTIHDVAKLAGVSTGTVSNVINKSQKVSPQTAERVLDAISKLNYIPNVLAKSLKTSQSCVLGILAEDIGASFCGNIIDGICEYCEDYEYSVSLCNLRVHRKIEDKPFFHYEDLKSSPAFKKSVDAALVNLMAARVCGIIYVSVYPRDVSNILSELNIPVVYAYAYTTKNDYCVNYNDYQGAKLAVEYLIKMGHKRIALICGSTDSIPTQKRLSGYRSSLEEHKLNLYSEYIRTGNWHYEDGYNQCLELLNLKNPPTAIFAMSDLMAFGAINACIDNGYRIPKDMSIHGFDNLDLSAYTNPALTTISLPLREIGVQAAKIMLHLSDQASMQNRSVLLPCSHISRQTVFDIN